MNRDLVQSGIRASLAVAVVLVTACATVPETDDPAVDGDGSPGPTSVEMSTEPVESDQVEESTILPPITPSQIDREADSLSLEEHLNRHDATVPVPFVYHDDSLDRLRPGPADEDGAYAPFPAPIPPEPAPVATAAPEPVAAPESAHAPEPAPAVEPAARPRVAPAAEPPPGGEPATGATRPAETTQAPEPAPALPPAEEPALAPESAPAPATIPAPAPGPPSVAGAATAPEAGPPSATGRPPALPPRDAPPPYRVPRGEREAPGGPESRGTAVVAAGREIEVTFPGTGWLYVGREDADDAVALLGRSRDDGDDVFRFLFAEPGVYVLWFQQQDTTSGSLANEAIVMRADPESEVRSVSPLGPVDGTAALPPEESAAPPAESGSDGPSDLMESIALLLNDGDSASAFTVLVGELSHGHIGIADVEQELLDRLVSAAADPTVSISTIRSFWEHVAGSRNPRGPEARLALLDIAARDGTPDEILDLIALFEADGDAGSASAARSLPDEALYRLARYLERTGPQRDLHRALSYYRLIIDERPLSDHWDDSRSRAEFLRRHYFDVR